MIVVLLLVALAVVSFVAFGALLSAAQARQAAALAFSRSHRALSAVQDVEVLAEALTTVLQVIDTEEGTDVTLRVWRTSVDALQALNPDFRDPARFEEVFRVNPEFPQIRGREN